MAQPYTPYTPRTRASRSTGRRRGRPARVRLVLILARALLRDRVRELDDLGVLQRRLPVPRLLDERHRALQAAPARTGARHRRSEGRLAAVDRKSTRLNSSHSGESRMPSSA